MAIKTGRYGKVSWDPARRRGARPDYFDQYLDGQLQE